MCCLARSKPAARALRARISARAIAKDGRRLMQWLRARQSISSISADTNPTCLPRHGEKVFGLTWRGYAGDVALARLEESLRQRQGRILRGMRARTLKLASAGNRGRDGRGRGAAKFYAPSVVIADGGFQANLDMIRAHISSAPEKLLARNGGTATGDGLPAWHRRSALRAPASTCFTAICTVATR